MTADGYTPQALVPRTRAAIAARGLRPVLGDYARFAAGLPRVVLGSNRRFSIWGQEYSYLEHPHKLSWLSERTGVPVAQAFVDRHPPRPRARGRQRALPLSAAAAHPSTSTSAPPEVLNRDVIDLSDLGNFDLIVASVDA